jgi:BatD DUF11 like domain
VAAPPAQPPATFPQPAGLPPPPALRPISFFVSILLFFFAAAAHANELTVDRRTIQIDETLQITVKLTGSFADGNVVDVPVKNLTVDGRASTSSSFTFDNGRVSKAKVFVFIARPMASGPALVGPLVVDDNRGNTETLAPIAVQVLPDALSGSGDPLRVLRELKATGRDPVFLLAEADRTTAWVGEEIVVTWYLYAGVSAEDFGIDQAPKLPDFWSETMTVKEPSQPLTLDGTFLHKVPIRRVALFPLRSGRLPIGALHTRIATVKRTSDPSALVPFEGNVVELRQRSQVVEVDVRPLPDGVYDAIGEVAMQCGAPSQKGIGPLLLEVQLSGNGNLRAAKPPHFASPIDGDFEIADAGVTVDREVRPLTMTRRWRIVVFPAHDGRLAIPPLVTTVFNPATGATQELRCGGSMFAAKAVDRPAPIARPAVEQAREQRRRLWPRLVAGVVIAGLLLPAVWWWRRARRKRAAIDQLLGDADPRAVRLRVDAHVGQPEVLLQERSARGDAYRAVRSLLDDLEHERYIEGDPVKELRRRVEDLLDSLPSS